MWYVRTTRDMNFRYLCVMLSGYRFRCPHWVLAVVPVGLYYVWPLAHYLTARVRFDLKLARPGA